MSVLVAYILKLSISLAVVYLFYQLVLRKHTFYNWNRWYLLGYTVLSFLIPFINITPLLENNRLGSNEMVKLIPSVAGYTTRMENVTQYPVPVGSPGWDKWDWTLFILGCGSAVLLIRLLIRYLSFVRIRRHAQLISDNGMKLYQVDKDIIPFSFGNAIFINPQLHREEELQEIIRHEFVHVRQGHTHDIIWGELLCILNWYNPFAWLIRRATRQNLEFIADRQVLQSGLDKKQYQYLLLKVIGNHHFSIANQFNFSSLKKRIAMMNKMKSARAHLFKFLFLLPLAAILLLAFRNENDRQNPAIPQTRIAVKDTIPAVPINEKGYFIDIKDSSGNCLVVVKDRSKKEIERVLLTKWKDNEEYYENLYGIILPPPPPPPAPPTPPTPPRLPAHVRSIQINNGHAVVLLKNGDKDEYDLNNASEQEAFEKKYGKMPPPPPAPLVSIGTGISPITGQAVAISSPTVLVAPGGLNSTVTGSVTPAVSVSSSGPRPVGTTLAGPVAMTSVSGIGTTLPAPAQWDAAAGRSGEKVMELKIYKSTSRDRLNQLISEAKSKGVELAFDRIDYNSKNELVSLSGKMVKGGSSNTFSITGFEEATLLLVKNNGKISCVVYTNSEKEEM